MTDELIEFIQKNSGSNVKRNSIRNFTNAVKNLSVWECDTSNRNENIKISNDNMYNVANFYKSFINNFVSVFPNIIMNKVNYDNIDLTTLYFKSLANTSSFIRNAKRSIYAFSILLLFFFFYGATSLQISLST